MIKACLYPMRSHDHGPMWSHCFHVMKIHCRDPQGRPITMVGMTIFDFQEDFYFFSQFLLSIKCSFFFFMNCTDQRSFCIGYGCSLLFSRKSNFFGVFHSHVHHGPIRIYFHGPMRGSIFIIMAPLLWSLRIHCHGPVNIYFMVPRESIVMIPMIHCGSDPKITPTLHMYKTQDPNVPKNTTQTSLFFNHNFRNQLIF